MNPEQQYNDPDQQPVQQPNSQPVQPQVYNPPQPMGIQQPTSPIPQPTTAQSKLPLIIIGAVVVLLVIVVIAIALSGGKKKPVAKTTIQTNTIQGPQPARAIDAEQANNSISQDISSMNDDKDFPATELDDKSIGL